MQSLNAAAPCVIPCPECHALFHFIHTALAHSEFSVSVIQRLTFIHNLSKKDVFQEKGRLKGDPQSLNSLISSTNRMKTN